MAGDSLGLTIALPKGRLAAEAVALLRAAGLHLSEAEPDERELVQVLDGGWRVIWVKPADVPAYVRLGVADAGITGADVLAEQRGGVMERLDLGIGRCSMQVAVAADKAAAWPQPLLSRSQGGRLRVATKYPQAARRHFEEVHGIEPEIVPLHGSVELAPTTGLADVIVDLVQTGRTLAANRLVAVEQVFEVTARWLVNPVSMRWRPELDRLTERLADAAAVAGRAGTVAAATPAVARERSSADPGPSELSASEPPADEVANTVRRVVSRVRREGDPALRELNRLWDGYAGELEPPRQVWRERAAGADREVMSALSAAQERISTYQEMALRQFHAGLWRDELGNEAHLRWRPVRRVGIYAPGGRALYPSSVLMAAIPARLAGVEELFLCTPPWQEGLPHPLILATAALVGIDRLFVVGGAQAIAAMAIGTQTVPKVDMIVGPGNAYVAEAKRQLLGQVGIDGLAGPSEVAVVVDAPRRVPAAVLELLAQAEHDPDARIVGLAVGAETHAALAQQLAAATAQVPRQAVVKAALAATAAVLPERLGALTESAPTTSGLPLVACADLDEALAYVERMAPEHLSLLVDEPSSAWGRVRNAPASFLGEWSPVAAGDYSAGTDHILPTGGSARWSGAVGVWSFLRPQQAFQGSEQGVAAWAGAALRIAQAEGLENHARAVAARIKEEVERRVAHQA